MGYTFWKRPLFTLLESGFYSTFIRVLKMRVPSARIFGLAFHLKTRGLAQKSQIEEILLIFEKYICFFGQYIPRSDTVTATAVLRKI
jgi:hypothetical protein